MSAPSLPVDRTSASDQRVTFTRRFFGDYLLENALMLVTLLVGWLIWLAIVARKGQTPAKSLLGVVILDSETGEIASAGQVWMREFIGKFVIESLIGVGLILILGGGFSGNAWNASGLYQLAAGFGALVSDENRAIWDYMAGTRLGKRPNSRPDSAATQAPRTVSERLQEIESLRLSGAISDVEYMAKRRQILDAL